MIKDSQAEGRKVGTTAAINNAIDVICEKYLDKIEKAGGKKFVALPFRYGDEINWPAGPHGEKLKAITEKLASGKVATEIAKEIGISRSEAMNCFEELEGYVRFRSILGETLIVAVTEEDK